MILSNYVQFHLLLFSICAGLFTGILFDLYRVIRGFQVSNKLLCFLEDLMFWILAAIIIFIFLLCSSDAIMNFNVYVFIAAGLYLYFTFFSKKLIFYEERVFKLLLITIRVLCKVLTYPFRLLLNKLFNKE